MELEYILIDRVCRLLEGLRSEFEGIRSQPLSREAPLSFDDTITQLLSKESRLQEQKGVSECSVFAITDQRSIRPTQNGQSAPTVNEIKKGQPKNRENQWCNYCKRKGYTKEKCWKLNGRAPQDMNGKFSDAHMVVERLYYLFELRKIVRGLFTDPVTKSRVDSDSCS